MDDARGCAVGGRAHIGAEHQTAADRRHPSTRLALASLTGVAIAIVSFVAGYAFQMQRGPSARTDTSPDSSRPVGVTAAGPLGRIRFAERLGDALELQSYRTAFTSTQTIAWRVELAEPPAADELTMVLAWYSARETMRLSATTVPIRDPALTVLARDEVQITDLVPTAGVYSVSYYAGAAKVAEGMFELLPRAP